MKEQSRVAVGRHNSPASLTVHMEANMLKATAKRKRGDER
jgi:hypothetical protein